MTQHHPLSQTSTLRTLVSKIYKHWQARRLRISTRTLLRTMSDERLKDIGLSRADIEQCYRADAFGNEGWLQARNDAHKKNER